MNLRDYIADAARRDCLASDLDTSPIYLWQLATRWRGRKPSPKMAQRIEAATDGSVTKESLRPDIWSVHHANPLQQAVEITGSQSALARECGVRQGHVWSWMYRDGGQPPLEHCPAIERATNGEIRCDKLRPDVTWQRDANGMVIGYTVPIGDRHAA